MEESRGWASDIGNGGVVIRTSVLTAIRNWRGDRFCGNTWVHIWSVTVINLVYSSRPKANLKKSFDVKGDVFCTQLGVLWSGKYGKHDAVCCFENLKES